MNNHVDNLQQLSARRSSPKTEKLTRKTVCKTQSSQERFSPNAKINVYIKDGVSAK